MFHFLEDGYIYIHYLVFFHIGELFIFPHLLFIQSFIYIRMDPQTFILHSGL